MALVVKDRVRVTSASTGTGTFTLGSAVTAFQDFSVIGDGNTTYYAIVDSTAGDWEVGIGTYTASGTTLSRDTILESSSGGTAVNFIAGIKDVFVTYPAEKAVYFDAADAVNIDNIKLDGNTISTTNSNGNLTVAPNGTGYAVFDGTQAVLLPKGNNTTDRPGTPVSGMLRYNTTINEFEGYNGTAWASVGGSAISNDTTTATDLFPAYLNATTGTAATVFTSNAQYLFKPSTGELKVKAPVASNGILVNATTMTSNYTIATGTNGLSVGPFTIASGTTLTIESGQRHLIL
jgi:hypothetical protein